MKRSSSDCILSEDSINVKIQDNHILRNITFPATSANILAILGPTGAGKTILLKGISGRQGIESGQVMLNDIPFDKQLRRRLGFVLVSS